MLFDLRGGTCRWSGRLPFPAAVKAIFGVDAAGGARGADVYQAKCATVPLPDHDTSAERAGAAGADQDEGHAFRRAANRRAADECDFARAGDDACHANDRRPARRSAGISAHACDRLDGEDRETPMAEATSTATETASSRRRSAAQQKRELLQLPGLAAIGLYLAALAGVIDYRRGQGHLSGRCFLSFPHFSLPPAAG